jgi:Domain of unknown function (DUF6457)
MNAKQWITTYAERLDTTVPSPEDFSLILNLAGEAAHASERAAAPVACWVAARAGVDLEQALEVARRIGTDAATGEDG